MSVLGSASFRGRLCLRLAVQSRGFGLVRQSPKLGLQAMLHDEVSKPKSDSNLRDNALYAAPGTKFALSCCAATCPQHQNNKQNA